jgi:hypothetical protein
MELLMNGFYLATVVAAFISISIASHLFVVGVLGPTTPGLLAAAALRIRRLHGAVGNLLNGWVAAMLARSERRAATWHAARERLR